MSTRDDIAAHIDYFGELGVTGVSKDRAWTEREARVSSFAGAQVPQVPGAPVAGEQMGLAAIRDGIGDCRLCKLCTTRSNIVFGVGNPNADLMFVGEAPGADEDEQGEPFVGRAGQLLTKIIEAMGYQRGDVYIANVLKCRPPNNRAPEPDEVATCEPFLFSQIHSIKPRVIVALGTHAAHALLKIDTPISRIRGQVLDFRGSVKLVPTFHPAYLLRSPDKKREVWEDMKKVRALLQDPE
jgi:DNA polymerase